MLREAIDGHGRGVRGARHAGRLGQRLALQRDAAAARSRRRPSSAASGVLERADAAVPPRRADAAATSFAARRRRCPRSTAPSASARCTARRGPHRRGRPPGAARLCDLLADAARERHAALGARRLRRRPRGRARRGRARGSAAGLDATLPEPAGGADVDAVRRGLRPRRRRPARPSDEARLAERRATLRGVPLERVGAAAAARASRCAAASSRSTLPLAEAARRLRATPCRRRWRPADVRRLRHLRARPRRRAPDLLRALRAAAPRPGERRHRRRPTAAASPC